VLLVTPNARSLFAHLEMFHRHCGHVSFYHPELWRCFLQHAGFTQVETGTNLSMTRGAVWGGELRGRVVRRGTAEAMRLPAFGLPYTAPTPGAPPVAAGYVDAGQNWQQRAASFAVPWFGQKFPVPTAPPLPEPGDLAPAAPALSGPGDPAGAPVQFERSLPMPADNLLRRLILRVKNFLARWIVLPYLDAIMPQVNERLQALAATDARLAATDARLAAADARLAATLAAADRQLAAGLAR
jgi:hypothetical protein